MLDAEKTPVLHCPTCYSTSFKTSRARPDEWVQRFFRKLPVRCKKCNMRIFASRSYAKWLRRQEGANSVDQPSTRSSMSPSEVAE